MPDPTTMQKRRRKTSKEERICPLCSQSFNKAEHLVRHIRAHAKEKPFECNVCGRMYARQDTLLRHRRSHQENDQSVSEEVTLDASEADNIHVAVPSHDDRSAPLRTMATHLGNSSSGGMNEHIFTVQSIPTRGSVSHMTSDSTSVSERQLLYDPGSAPTTVTSYTTVDSRLHNTNDGNGPGFGDADLPQSGMVPPWGTKDGLPTFSIDSFFDGVDFNLDDLNLSFLNATGEYPLQPALLENPEMSAQIVLEPNRSNTVQTDNSAPRAESAVQQSWHTYSGPLRSGYVTPDPRQSSSRVDEDYHRTLAARLQPQVQEATLPSTTFLDLCVQAYFANFHPILPIVHASTFRPHAQNGLLLLSICSIGSLFIGSARAVSQGTVLFERLNKAILSTWDVLMTKSDTSSFVGFQASVIGQIFGLLVGRPKDLMQVQLFHGSVVVWSRRLNLFRERKPRVDFERLDDRPLGQAWKKWIVQEEKRRAALALLLLDAEIARMFHHEPALRQALRQLPRSSSKEAFSAPTARSWREVMLKDEAQQNNHDTHASFSSISSGDDVLETMFPPASSELNIYVLLEQLGTMATESRDLMGARSHSAIDCERMLIYWHERYRFMPAFTCQEASLMILWHSIFMSLNMDLDMLESAAGRDGFAAAMEHRNSVKAWARSPQARRCVVHSVMVQRQFESIAVGSEPPVHAPICLYRCGIAWYCFVRFGTGQRPGQNELTQTPELRCIGVDGNIILADDVGPRMGRPVEGGLIRIVDLLQRITHWKVADRLASTLLALVDNECGLY